ncbi:hypothetical protein BGZ93_002568 [Podila epicladia]|nr:hypothetical protein BGZ92_000120 [Podila epicladia]KAG0097513.1 hypothetical protein BGZ93_002568 [Podila epicladia]
MHSALCRRTSSPSNSSSSLSATSKHVYSPLLMVSKCFGDKIDRHPLALVMIQYSMAATQAFTLYFLSVICSLVHSVVIIATIEGLDWIQSFGPLVFEWDSFLFGAIFLTMEIDLGSMDPASKSYYISKHEEEARSYAVSTRGTDKSTPQQLRHHNKPSSSISSNSSHSSHSKRVTFDEQVLVLGTATVAKYPHITPIDTRIDPTVPLTESPTRTSPPRCASPQLIDPHSSSGKRFIHKIMHPHQHKRQQQQQQQVQSHVMALPCPDTTDSCASSISSTGSNSSKKSLAQRLGLKKKKQL